MHTPRLCPLLSGLHTRSSLTGTTGWGWTIGGLLPWPQNCRGRSKYDPRRLHADGRDRRHPNRLLCWRYWHFFQLRFRRRVYESAQPKHKSELPTRGWMVRSADQGLQQVRPIPRMLPTCLAYVPSLSSIFRLHLVGSASTALRHRVALLALLRAHLPTLAIPMLT